MSLVFLLLGLVTGSFLKLCICRLLREDPVVTEPSPSDACGQRLRLFDLFPLLSYFRNREMCYYGASIRHRVPLIEATTALIFVLLWNHYGLSLQLTFGLLFASFLLIIVITDLEHHLIPNRIIYLSILLALVVPAVTPGQTIATVAIGGAIGAGLLLPLVLLFPGGMGMGDVKLAALVGLLVGFPNVTVALLVAFILGGAIASVLLATGLKRRKDPIAFAPFLVAGLILATLYGEQTLKLLVRW